MKALLTCCVALAGMWFTAAAAELTVFAAASLTDALKETAVAYEKKTGDKPVFNFAASSLLERQIESGAPADVFFSADEAKLDALDAKGLIVKETRRRLLSNALVIVVAADSPGAIASASDLTNAPIKRIALADPAAVPAGIYAKSYLEGKNLWAAIEPKIVRTDNVRSALAAVESGNIDAGIVFRTDAAISKKVKVALEIPPADGPKISYPVAVLKDSKRVEAAKQFVQYLASDDATKVFEKYGFVVLHGK